MFKKKANRTFILGWVLWLSACGQTKQNTNSPATPPAPSAVGIWEDDTEFRTRGALAKQRFEITQDSFTRVVRCTFASGGSVEVSASSPAKLDFRTIDILESQTKSTTRDNQRCVAIVQQQLAMYSLVENKMEIRLDDSTLHLRRR